MSARLPLLFVLKPVPVLLGSGGGASSSSSLLCDDMLADPALSVVAIDLLAGGTAGGIADLAPTENLRSVESAADTAGDTGLLNKLGFLGLIGGAGFLCDAADVADDIDLRDGDGEMVGLAAAGASSLCVLRLGGNWGLPLTPNGGGSLRGALDAVEEERVTSDDDGILSTLTQSGSSLGVNGFPGRARFGTEPLPGGFNVEDAGNPEVV